MTALSEEVSEALDWLRGLEGRYYGPTPYADTLRAALEAMAAENARYLEALGRIVAFDDDDCGTFSKQTASAALRAHDGSGS